MTLEEVTASNAAQAFARLSKVPVERGHVPQLVAWLADPPWHSTSAQPFYKLILERLEQTGDAKTAAALASAAKRNAEIVKGKSMRGWFAERIEKTRGVLASRTKAPKIAAPSKARTGDIASLLAAIYAAPDDDAVRTVYADALVEQDDPRGAFIQMQLARAGREPTAAERKAELALLAKHARTWLGPLASVVGGLGRANLAVGPTHAGNTIRFERGFLAGCFVGHTAKKLAPAIGAPELATVEALVLGSNTDRLLEETPLPALRRLAIDSTQFDIAHARFARQLAALELTGAPSPAFVKAVERCADMPALTELAISLQCMSLAEGAAVVRAATKLPQITRLFVWHFAGAQYERAGKKWRLVDHLQGVEADCRALDQLVGAK